jgi:nucleotide-binding universal stress UspA family protein
MKKKIMLAVDNSRPSKNAIWYAVQMTASITDLHFVLFHAQPGVSLFLQEEARKSAKAKKQLDQVLSKNDAVANKLLDDHKNQMVAMGIEADRIECITKKRNLGFAKDILEFGQEGRYDAIVIGRRGLSRLAELYAGSVTTNILEQSRVIPIWVVDGEAQAGKLVVAVDGSEASLRAVDHVSFMLSNNANARLTLLHITGNARKYCEIDFDTEPDPELEEIVARGDKACLDQFYPHAVKKLEDAGISADRVTLEIVKEKRRIGKAILDFAARGKFSTVVVGRRGIDKAFFMGSVSRYVINKISNGALWIIP